MGRVTVVDYDPSWPARFEALRLKIWESLRDVAVTIEHVGSTSVAGLAAKPVIDIDVVVEKANVAEAVRRMQRFGCTHSGDRGVPQREAFREPRDGPKHNVYVCVAGSLALRNHLAVRNSLRGDPAKAAAYAALKRDLAERHAEDIDAYIAGKSAFLAGILAQSGMNASDLAEIARINSIEKLRAIQ